MGDYWFSRFVGAVALLMAVATGTVRDYWWMWLVFWLLSEVRGFVSERLIYWQRRHIEALKESERLNIRSERRWS